MPCAFPVSVSTSRKITARPDKPEVQAAGFPRPFGERYVLLKELGKGGMGQVFVALSGGDGVERVCALKIIRHLTAPGREPEELGRRFLDEAKVVTKLSHENLVYVFDFGLVDRDAYLAMEYVRGKSLTEVWNRCAVKGVGFPLGVAMYAIVEIAAGLAYAHDLDGLNLVHRDISPSNLMLSYTGGVKLIDFGLAKWKSKLAQTITGINWGKISYMSPEQYTGKPIDRRSDVFSLGVLLWEMLTGKQLFPSEEIRQGITELVPASRWNANVSETLDRIVMRALAFDPEDRYQTGAELAAALLGQIPRDAGKLQLKSFLAQLFDADARAEAEEEERLVAAAVVVRKSQPRPAVGTPLAAERDPLVGTTLEDRYFVRRLVGEGAMGRVYEGHHTGVGKRVAIKVPRHAERRKAELVQRFKLEANAASQIGHPNIADVTDCGNTPAGDFFFVMEYIDGLDVDRLIRREGALPLERVLVIGVQVCRALEAAHKAGIIHRDLKPSNVMLVRTRDDTEQVKVLDFGVAKFLRSDSDADLTNAEAAVGTPRFMAPEQIQRGTDIDFRVDIYALGGILYAMLSGGHAPVDGDSVQEVWRRKVNDPPKPLSAHRSDMPPSLDALVMRCLSPAPDARPASMEALRRELVAILEETRTAGSSVLGMRVPSDTARIPPGQGARRPFIAVGVGLSLLLVGGVIAVLNRGKPAPEASPPLLLPAAPLPATAALPPPAPAPVTAPAPVSPVSAAPAGTATPAAPAAAAPVIPAGAATPAAPAAAATPAPAGTAAPAATRPAAARPSAAPAVAPTAERVLDQADAAYNRGRLADALSLAQKAAAIDGGSVRAHTLVGKAKLQLGDYDEAAAAFSRALKLDPAHPAALKGLELARRAGHPAEPSGQ